MDGAQVLVKCLEEHGVEYIFGLSGGAAIPIFDALVTTATKIKLVLVRHEQGAAHMADGYARATGKPGVVLVTSGPGAGNTLTGLMTAHMDSIPIIVICGQQVKSMLGKDAFQEADIFSITLPVVKHSYLVKDTADIRRIVREAFHIAATGRPGPVLIDIPKDVSQGECPAEQSDAMDLRGYRTQGSQNAPALEEIAAALRKSTRPIILAGHGVLISKASKELRSFAERLSIPVTTTLLGKGAFPENHPLSLGMLGMHGTAYANKAIVECDLIMGIGARFDDRIIGKPESFCRNAVRIHIDIDRSEVGKMIKPNLFAITDANAALDVLSRLITTPPNVSAWIERVSSLKRRFPLRYAKRGGLKMQEILEALCEMTGGKAVLATDVGQHQMWAAQFYKTDIPDNWITSGGAGTMGFGLPAAIGAQFGRPSDLVCAIVGDGGFQMTMSELATAAIHKLPIKVLVLNNHYLGMVRQWQELFYENRESGVDLKGNPDFVKLAESYEGVRGFHLHRRSQIRKVLTKALEYVDGPCVINAEVEKADNVYPMIPAGMALEDMILEAPRIKLEKPTGST